MENLSQAKIKIYLADNTEEDSSLLDYFTTNDKYEVVGHDFVAEKIVSDVIELQPDFLIMELVLSGMDGFMVIDKLKKSTSKMPKIIFTSKVSHGGFVSKALSYDCVNYFMVKPITPENLEERIMDIQHPSTRSAAEDRYLDERISNIFITIGIPAHIKGYQFLREAVKLAIEEPEIIGSITKRLYPTIAEKFSTSSSKVERGMRHAIEVAWNRGKIENINSVFGLRVYTSTDKPTNGELIALIADKMLVDG